MQKERTFSNQLHMEIIQEILYTELTAINFPVFFIISVPYHPIFLILLSLLSLYSISFLIT
jgi:hypothetical protein